jgi:16S rRNA U516 pseudouridylate synthase RsuA-like enzyme
VTVGGVVASSPGDTVDPQVAVELDGRPLHAPRRAAVLYHKPAGEAIEIVHPPGLEPVRQLKVAESGAELLLADHDLAVRVGDPAHPQPESWRGRHRRAYAGLAVDGLEPGAWRPLSPKELGRLRLAVRLPPNPTR